MGSIEVVGGKREVGMMRRFETVGNPETKEEFLTLLEDARANRF